jgi:hypothetical protein
MNDQLDLKEIERKAFVSTYQDGLWDIYYGLILIAIALFAFRPAGGYTPVNLVLAIAGFCIAGLAFWLGKKFITVPRMGQVEFGPVRKKRNRTLGIVMGCIVLVQAVFVFLQFAAWLRPDIRDNLGAIMPEGRLADMLVASIGALFIGPSMLLIAYFKDFPRGYYIAPLMALAVFLMIYLNRPLYPLIIGGLILLPGVVFFVRFVQRYPNPNSGRQHG